MTACKERISANWHLTDSCNYHCRFCFANNFNGRTMDSSMVPKVIEGLVRNGVTKLNLAGGEPLLSDHLISVARSAKDAGMVVSVITNGSLLRDEKLQRLIGIVDWIGISIDSMSERVEAELGRGNGDHVRKTISLCGLLRECGIKLKINTVVTSLNSEEDLHSLISEIRPRRWKVFRMLKVEGQNHHASSLSIDGRRFQGFVQRHADVTLENGGRPVFEDNRDMIGSYLMIAPNGDLFKFGENGCQYLGLDSWMDNGWQSFFDYDGFVRRGGEYDWKSE